MQGYSSSGKDRWIPKDTDPYGVRKIAKQLTTEEMTAMVWMIITVSGWWNHRGDSEFQVFFDLRNLFIS